MTNGLLFDRRTFDELDLRGRVVEIMVSVDAVREETYRVVQRGGDFERLLASLEFIDDLRIRQGENFRLTFAFVVSVLNFRELPEFVRLGKRFHASQVDFNLIRNQSGFSAGEFARLNIANPNHPEHGEFLEVLGDKELSDPCVGWGSLGYLRPT
jgi:wyosine [tRNA(Phe)-imidazoG37] synthetase (radical SAM superfamily)